MDERAGREHLYRLAQRLEVPGRSRMSESELPAMIREENRARTRSARGSGR